MYVRLLNYWKTLIFLAKTKNLVLLSYDTHNADLLNVGKFYEPIFVSSAIVHVRCWRFLVSKKEFDWLVWDLDVVAGYQIRCTCASVVEGPTYL